MPHLPAMLAGLARKFSRKGVVRQLTTLSPGMLRVDLDVAGQWAPGSSAEFLVSRQDLRHYTVLGDGAVYVQLHSDGPGTAWARKLSVGDEVHMLGPGGRPWLRPGRRQLMLGDASAIGLFRALIDALPGDAEVVGAVEAPMEDCDAVKALLPELEVVELGEPGQRLHEWLRGHTSDVDAGYLAGHAQSLVTLRKELLTHTPQRNPVARKALVVQGYWATGKAGL